jgi:hypothetical protein
VTLLIAIVNLEREENPMPLKSNAPAKKAARPPIKSSSKSRALTLQKDRAEFVAFVKGRKEQYQQAVAHLKAPGHNLRRLHAKFARIYAACCAAMRFRKFPFTEAALLEAVMTCELEPIAFPPTMPASRTPFAALKAYLNGPIAQAFIDLRPPGASVPPGHVHATAFGYLGLHRGNKEIWLPHECFRWTAKTSLESRALKAELHAKRLIATEGQGARRHFTVKRDIPGLGRVRVIALRAP